MRHTKLAAVLLASTLLAAGASSARGEDWQYSLAPYLWGAGLDGDVGAGPVEVAVDASFSDIVENLDGGLLAHFEASKGGRWTLLADLVFLDLGSESTLIDADVEQTILEGGAAFRVGEITEVLFGARWVDLGADIDVTGPLGGPFLQLDVDQDWIDPFVGARWNPRFNEVLSFLVRVDLGGLGVGSEITWNAAFTVRWQPNDRLTVGVGYRAMGIDYEDEGPRFVYDVVLAGPLLGVGFRL